MSPNSALQKLRLGNEIYVNGGSSAKLLNCSFKRRRLATDGQNPFAVVVTCADSRVPAEAIFHTELGDLFVIRIAGCCVDSSVVASIEYAVSHFQCQVCVVMSHSQCGAISAALQSAEDNSALPSENLSKMLAPLKAAMSVEMSTSPFSSKAAKMDRMTKLATFHQIDRLKSESPLISKKEEDGQLRLVPAVYNIDTGNVEFDLNEVT
ncbi:MAG: hypothetical protein NT027_13305 [Proteobacteria bacterium]|nr:hypothetical protein [Pseudomonadota bacterium]